MNKLTIHTLKAVENTIYNKGLFTLVTQSELAEKYVKNKQPSFARRYLRLVRFGIIGESLLDFSFTKEEVMGSQREANSALVDAYIFYARTIFDSITYDLKDLYKKELPTGFGKLYDKIDIHKDKLPPDLGKLIREDRISFKKLRKIRNALKDNAVCTNLLQEDGQVYINIIGEHRGEEFNLKEKLDGFVFGIAFDIWILMTPSVHEIQRSVKIE